VSKRFGAWLVVVPVLALSVVAFAPPAVQAADIVGRGSVGGNLGGMKFLTGDDFGEGNVRFIGQAVFKYNFTSGLAGVLESGWGWNAYPNDIVGVDDTLATVVPTTLGLEFRKQKGEGHLWPHVGVGVGLYSLGVKDSFRTYAYAKDGTERLNWTKPGIYGKVGVEYLFDKGVSLNWDFVYHMIFAEDSSRFDKWGNQNTSFGEFRMGANYYFTIKQPSAAPPEEKKAEEKQAEESE
jgi:hypothetical protein